MTITCKYSCHGCGLDKVECEVPARTTEDVVVWVTTICGQAIANDHLRRSPFCSATCCDLMIPISGASKVGGVVEN